MISIHHWKVIFRLEKMKICKPILLLTSPTLFLGLLLCINAENDLDYFRLLDDRLMYRIEYKSADDFPHELEDAKERLVQITSSDQEQYQCIIPAVSSYVSPPLKVSVHSTLP